jgi:predicted Rossmann fold flavoprotein
VKDLRAVADGGYELDTDRGLVQARKVVIATGGLSIPAIGATDFGFRVAKQFGLRTVEPRPGLVPLTFDGAGWAPYAGLAGLALPVLIETGDKKNKTVFAEDLLFTHRGLSGPAILQISSYWREGQAIGLDLCPGVDVAAALRGAKQENGRALLRSHLARLVPEKLARHIEADLGLEAPLGTLSNAVLERVARQMRDWPLRPVGSEGYRTAEVTLGGVDTDALDARTMEAKGVPGLYFVGEVVDVTGWLGGYNFQWAWSSGWAAGQVA